MAKVLTVLYCPFPDGTPIRWLPWVNPACFTCCVEQLRMVVPNVAYVAGDRPGLLFGGREGLEQVDWWWSFIAHEPFVVLVLVEAFLYQDV